MTNEFDNKRQDYNRALVRLLAKLVEENPTQRFGQMLSNYGFVTPVPVRIMPDDQFDVSYWQDEYYQESIQLHKRVNEYLDPYLGILSEDNEIREMSQRKLIVAGECGDHNDS